jgi:hypothetical protein
MKKFIYLEKAQTCVCVRCVCVCVCVYCLVARYIIYRMNIKRCFLLIIVIEGCVCVFEPHIWSSNNCKKKVV